MLGEDLAPGHLRDPEQKRQAGPSNTVSKQLGQGAHPHVGSFHVPLLVSDLISRFSGRAHWTFACTFPQDLQVQPATTEGQSFLLRLQVQNIF